MSGPAGGGWAGARSCSKQGTWRTTFLSSLVLPAAHHPPRRFLSDLAAAQARAACWDARRQTPDLMSLPGAGRWLASVQLAATDLQAVLLYDRSLALLGALAFVDRPVSVARASSGWE